MASKDIHLAVSALNEQRLDEKSKNTNLHVRCVHVCQPLLDDGKGIGSYGNNPIDCGAGLIAVDWLQIIVKNQAARSLNDDECCGDIPFILRPDIDDAIDLPCSHKS